MVTSGIAPWWNTRSLCLALRPVALTLLALMAMASPATAQTAVGRPMPAWQVAAGEKLTFDAASIRPTEPGKFTPPNFPLGVDESYTATRGRLTGVFPLWPLISCAYMGVRAPSQ
jgi:hypothetical protein